MAESVDGFSGHAKTEAKVKDGEETTTSCQSEQQATDNVHDDKCEVSQQTTVSDKKEGQGSASVVSPDSSRQTQEADNTTNNQLQLETTSGEKELSDETLASSTVTPKSASRPTTPTPRSTPNVTPTNSAPSTPKPRMPFRWGITWKKGEKLEAMDYMDQWYLAKIVDFHCKDKKVLIHFDGWNSRYDEWFAFDSERMRPLTRSSGRQQKKKFDHEYSVGDKILAKWSDCKMYPASIETINKDGSYGVKFDDGFKKVSLPSSIRPVVVKQEDKKTVKSEVKDIKTLLDTPKTSKKDKRRESTGSSKGKLIVAGSFLVKREKREETENTKTPKSEKSKEASASVKVKKEVGVTKEIGQIKFEKIINLSPKVKLSPIKTKVVGVKRTRKKAFSTPAITVTESEDISVSKRAKSIDKSPRPLTAPKEFIIETDHNPFKCDQPDCGKSFRKESLLHSHIKFYHTPGPKTPSMPAPRKRRKTSSICSSDSDHSSKGKTTPGSSKRKRHISMDVTIDTSPVTVPFTPESPGTTSQKDIKPFPKIEASPSTTPTSTSSGKRSRNASQESVKQSPKVSPKELVKESPKEKMVKKEEEVESEIEDEEDEEPEENDDVAHCACGYHYEDGLMIQCEVCLSWQHAACFNITENSLPKKYICYVCLNPPGIRESRRHIQEQDWYKHGQLPAFNFLPGKASSVQTDEMQDTQDLAGQLQKLAATQLALKTQLQIIRQKNHPAVKIWRTNWDNPSESRTTSQVDEYISEEANGPSTSAGNNGQLLNYLDYSAFLAQIAEGKDMTDLNCEDSSTDSAVSSRSVMLEDEESSNQIPPEQSVSAATSVPSEESVINEAPSGSGTVEDNVVAGSNGASFLQTKSREIMEAEIQEKCEKNMLFHILRVQNEINSRLDAMDDKISVLEAKEGLSGNEDLPPAAPRLKRAIRNSIRDVNKLKLMSELCGTKPRKQH